jgi:hypothetical protein
MTYPSDYISSELQTNGDHSAIVVVRRHGVIVAASWQCSCGAVCVEAITGQIATAVIEGGNRDYRAHLRSFRFCDAIWHLSREGKGFGSDIAPPDFPTIAVSIAALERVFLLDFNENVSTLAGYQYPPIVGLAKPSP